MLGQMSRQGYSKLTKKQRKKLRQNASKVLPDGTFAKGGGAVGNWLGDKVGLGGAGRVIGKGLGDFFSKLVGFGDYTVQSNSLYNQGVAVPHGDTVPSFGVRGHAVTIKHREFVKDILVPAVPTDFTIQSYRINAGDTSLFPWLASVATNFQQFKVIGMVIEFKSMSADVTAGGALGSVIMATDYNALAPDFVDKLHMENSEYAVSTKPSQSQLHSIECARSATAQEMLYVRNNTSSSTTSQDPRLYDLGLFQIATVGLPGSAGEVLGELWVTYDIELYKPLIVDETYNSGQVVCATGCTPAVMFGTDPAEYGTIVSVDDNDLDFARAGEYLIAFRMVGTGLTGYPTFTFSGTGSGTLRGSVFNAAGTSCDSVYTVVVSSGESMIFDATAIATTITQIRARVAPYNYDLA